MGVAHLEARKLALLLFSSLTLIFVVAAAFAAGYYLEVAHSVQVVEIRASSFQIMIDNASIGSFSFNLIAINPSGAPLSIQVVSYSIYLNEKFIAVRAIDYFPQGLEVPRESSTTFTIATRLTTGEIAAITAASAGGAWNWEMNGTLRLRTAIDSSVQVPFSQDWSS